MRTLINVVAVLASVALTGCGWFQPCVDAPTEQSALAPASLYRVCLPSSSARPQVGVGFTIQAESSYGDHCQATVNVDAGTIDLVVWGMTPRRTGRCGLFGTEVSAREDAVAPIYTVSCDIPALPAGNYQINDVAPGVISVPYNAATDGGILDCY